jgi:hypothetical protein
MRGAWPRKPFSGQRLDSGGAWSRRRAGDPSDPLVTGPLVIDPGFAKDLSMIHVERRPPGEMTRSVVVLLLAWLAVGVLAGVRLHRAGGTFGEQIPLLTSIAVNLINAAPWLMAAIIAAWAARRWPFTRDAWLPSLTWHLALGMGVVVLQQLLLAAMRATLLPPGLRPWDTWRQMGLDLVRWGPVALGVYAILLFGAILWARRATPHSTFQRPSGEDS